MNCKYIPLGSIVLLKGGAKKLMVVGRALQIRNGESTVFFDYAGVPYPEGLMGDQVAYFNQDNIARLVFSGFSDIDNENVVDNINRWLEEHPDLHRGNVSQLG